MKHLRTPAMAVGVAVVVVVAAACGSSTHATDARPATPTGWLGEQSATAPQNKPAVVNVPRSFRGARLLVALVAADGPDTVPLGRTRLATTAVFGGSNSLQWTRAARVSARHDWALPRGEREQFGASVAEVWTVVPRSQWSAGGTITITTTHPESRDDGLAVTIAAFSHGTLSGVKTDDGLRDRPARTRVRVTPGAVVYAATFAGSENAAFTPLNGLRLVVQRRAGDDTAGVLASPSGANAAGPLTVGYAAPKNPGDFWEMAVAVVTPAP